MERGGWKDEGICSLLVEPNSTDFSLIRWNSRMAINLILFENSFLQMLLQQEKLNLCEDVEQRQKNGQSRRVTLAFGPRFNFSHPNLLILLSSLVLLITW